VLVASSAGGISALGSFLSGAAWVLSRSHRRGAATVPTQHLPELSGSRSAAANPTAREVGAGSRIAASGNVYLTPQDSDPVDGSLSATPALLSRSRLNGNSLLQSPAVAFGDRALALILSGALSDGSEGAVEIGRLGDESWRSLTAALNSQICQEPR
jgi:chemotaxis response regulator CheB